MTPKIFEVPTPIEANGFPLICLLMTFVFKTIFNLQTLKSVQRLINLFLASFIVKIFYKYFSFQFMLDTNILKLGIPRKMTTYVLYKTPITF